MSLNAAAVDASAQQAPSLLKSLAADAIEHGVHTVVRRAAKSARRAIETLEDSKDDAVHYIKHQPLKTIGLAAGVGLVTGAALGWLISRAGSARATD